MSENVQNNDEEFVFPIRETITATLIAIVLLIIVMSDIWTHPFVCGLLHL